MLPADISPRSFLGLPLRFWQKVSIGEGCWLWTGSKTSHGYGQLNVGGRPVGAHRLMAEAVYGPLGSLHACHHCDTPGCVRPDHLFPGTASDNMQDKARKGRAERNNWRKAVAKRVANQRTRTEARTHCASGHELTPYPDGRKRCRPCEAEAARAYYWRTK